MSAPHALHASATGTGEALTAPIIQTAGPLASERRRLDSVDLLRGVVMAIMLLDHTRMFVHAGAAQYDPTDLASTNAAVFFTRWITHFCAPVFVFLAGTGAFLQLSRGKSKTELSRFLLTRGLWLIVVEFVLVRAVVTFNFAFASFLGFVQVIWVLGISMIVLAALVHLPLRATAAIGLLMIGLHNLLDAMQVSTQGAPVTALPQILWLFLHQPGLIQFGEGGPVMWVAYPLVPWIGVMAVGFAFGALYHREEIARRRLMIALGVGAVALFVVLRAMNGYGDPASWSAQERDGFTLLSFLNTTKYPPSLLFLTMTLGPALLALAWFERLDSSGAAARAPLRWLVTFGRVPLFFYLLQWLAAHLMGIALNLFIGRSPAYLLFGPPDPASSPADAGFPLWTVYLCWLAGLVLLYFPCRWFAELKRRRGREWRWLSYM